MRDPPGSEFSSDKRGFVGAEAAQLPSLPHASSTLAAGHQEPNPSGAQTMDTSDVIHSVNDVHAVGTLASILHIRQDDNAAQLIVQGHRRIRAIDEVEGSVPLQLRIEHLDEEPPNLESETVKAYTNELISTMREVVTMNPMLREYINGFYMRFDVRDPYRLVRGAGCGRRTLYPTGGGGRGAQFSPPFARRPPLRRPTLRPASPRPAARRTGTTCSRCWRRCPWRTGWKKR